MTTASRPVRSLVKGDRVLRHRNPHTVDTITVIGNRVRVTWDTGSTAYALADESWDVLL